MINAFFQPNHTTGMNASSLSSDCGSQGRLRSMPFCFLETVEAEQPARRSDLWRRLGLLSRSKTQRKRIFRQACVAMGRIAVIAVFALVLCSPLAMTAGELDSPADPDDAAGAMWTVEDIYDVLDTRTTNVVRRGVGFSDPSSGPTAGTMHNLNDIMGLVTNRAPVPKTGQTPTVPLAAPAGSDGDLEKGVTWANPRFTDNGNGTVTDNKTGLIWLKDANAIGRVVWTNAVAQCNLVADGMYGLTDGSSAGDWRLPAITELFSLVHWGYHDPALSNTEGTGKMTDGDPFANVQSHWSPDDYYWSSTTYAGSTSRAWCGAFCLGRVILVRQKSETQYVWPVRGGGQ